MRILRSILIFTGGLSLIGLVAVNLALASREPQGPDLGVIAKESGTQAGPERDARLVYMGQILGRWSADGRCKGEQDQWLFARRRVIVGGMECEIRRFVPGDPVDLDLQNCVASVADAADGPINDMRSLKFERPNGSKITLRGDVKAELERCK